MLLTFFIELVALSNTFFNVVATLGEHAARFHLFWFCLVFPSFINIK